MKHHFQKITIRNKTARYLELSKNGENAHFYGANGFPLGAYDDFLSRLSLDFSLSALSLRACWPEIGQPKKQTPWQLYADDLISFIEQKYESPIVGIGHSQGATATLLAAAKRPELFSRLIIIEPASVSPPYELLLKLVPYFYKKRKQPIKSALEKQDIWESKEEFYTFYRAYKPFRRISDSVLMDFCNAALKEMEDGRFELVFSKYWEASNYSLAISIQEALKQIKFPMHVIAGKPSIFFTAGLRKEWELLSKNSTLTERHEFGHLFPLEAPGICADLVLGDEI